MRWRSLEMISEIRTASIYCETWYRWLRINRFIHLALRLTKWTTEMYIEKDNRCRIVVRERERMRDRASLLMKQLIRPLKAALVPNDSGRGVSINPYYRPDSYPWRFLTQVEKKAVSGIKLYFWNLYHWIGSFQKWIILELHGSRIVIVLRAQFGRSLKNFVVNKFFIS